MRHEPPPCPHLLQVWNRVPHPRYGNAQPHYVAQLIECGGPRLHDYGHERFGRFWR